MVNETWQTLVQQKLHMTLSNFISMSVPSLNDCFAFALNSEVPVMALNLVEILLIFYLN